MPYENADFAAQLDGQANIHEKSQNMEVDKNQEEDNSFRQTRTVRNFSITGGTIKSTIVKILKDSVEVQLEN